MKIESLTRNVYFGYFLDSYENERAGFLDLKFQNKLDSSIIYFKDKMLIFSSESWHDVFSKSDQRGTLRGTGWTLFAILWTYHFWQKSKSSKSSIQNSVPPVPLSVPLFSRGSVAVAVRGRGPSRSDFSDRGLAVRGRHRGRMFWK